MRIDNLGRSTSQTLENPAAIAWFPCDRMADSLRFQPSMRASMNPRDSRRRVDRAAAAQRLAVAPMADELAANVGDPVRFRVVVDGDTVTVGPAGDDALGAGQSGAEAWARGDAAPGARLQLPAAVRDGAVGVAALGQQAWFDNFDPWQSAIHYTLAPAAVGQIVSRHAAPGADGDGLPTATADHWYFYDHIGNVVGQTAASGQQSSLYTQDAFGNVLGGGWGDGYHQTTKQRDRVTGDYYFNARWYEPECGRFTSRDPIGFIDGPNLYAFNRNSPVRFADPEGTFSVFIFTCMIRIAKEVEAEYAEGGTGYFMHCLVSCRAARECGLNLGFANAPIVLFYGYLHEVVGGGVFDWCDIGADAIGVGAGLRDFFDKGCEAKCAEIYPAITR